MAIKRERDVEKNYPKDEFVQKLRRLADALEQNKAFEISVAGERLYIPATAEISVEHEQSDSDHELEFQLRWRQG